MSGINPEWIAGASTIAKKALVYAIDNRDKRNDCMRRGWLAEAALYSIFMRRWAKDFRITVTEWSLDKRTGPNYQEVSQ